MHLVSDEIYANSVFPGEKFVSVAKIMKDLNKNTNYLGDYVHICGGFSKDFALSGFRAGICFTHNQDLYGAMDSLGYFQTVSTFTQNLLTKMLQDEKWTQSYLKASQQRLKSCYEALVDCMDAIGVKVFPCQGTQMAWVDFRKYLKGPKDAAAEEALWIELAEKDKVIFTTGESCKSDIPGFFRLCFAYPDIGDSKDPTVAIKELKKRLVKKFGKKK